MKLLTAIVVLRLGAFAIGCAAFAAGSYFGWAYSGWLLVPTVIAGIRCASLSVGENEPTKT